MPILGLTIFALIVFWLYRKEYLKIDNKTEIGEQESQKQEKMSDITNSWIIDQIKMLLEKCPFEPKDQCFILNPKHFYNIHDYRDKVAFLIKRYNLPFENIEIRMHADLEHAGEVRLQRIFDTGKLDLRPEQKIVSFRKDGTFFILDLSNSNSPKIIEVNKPLPLKSINLLMFLNQNFIEEEMMSAIITHEISHLYLYFKGLQNFDSSSEFKDQDEYLTDITAFVIGLGSIMLNGCGTKIKTIHQPSQIITRKTKLGYLSFEQMKFAQEQILARIPDNLKPSVSSAPNVVKYNK